jgi:hypothetical protein
MGLTPPEQLRALGERGILTLPEARGGITALLWDMDVCYCPHGRGHFDQKSHPPRRWDPSVDHHPVLKVNGGSLVRGNVRLAHIFCNRLAFGEGAGHEEQRRREAGVQAQWHKDHPEESVQEAGDRADAKARWKGHRAAAQLNPNGSSAEHRPPTSPGKAAA